MKRNGNEDRNNTFESSDFFIVAFLLAKGFQLLSTRQLGPKKILFVLRDAPEREELIAAFYAGQALVNPLGYQNELKNLKSLIYTTLNNGSPNGKGDNKW